ncbi:glycosyltransferase family 2 protein [Lentibacter sp. XHP0401]|uniref:glycosyltransferase family 2 protein n=1 Tax=Lentibacter sp. XHP0401 TaxID=2984334 RepID=UPI0021E7C65B|nr:glycosyltransferase family 2 protein [Lentibacter sp. XHP0401]MCV2893924.1 glycosyltransferase family 2 protein [Lentibacter sp. XHP0401]
MSTHLPKWGIVSTIKAPIGTIERFAAYHLELGAERLFIYLDDDNEAAFKALKTHPKIRVLRTHGEHWRSRNRPVKHQARQGANARHAYKRKAHELDWLAHIDVDEFLWPIKTPIAEQLAALPVTCMAARVRPVEALWHRTETHFKAMTNDRKQRQRETEAIYPTFGTHLNGGFLSHVAGKLFVRTGAEEVDLRIHNVFIKGDENPGQVEFIGTELCHLHATSFEHWMENIRYRLAHGVYRAGLKPNRPPERGGLTLNELLRTIEDSDGTEGLKAFYQEVCTATPELLQRLKAHGLLRSYDLALEEKRRKHFPTD